jgi:hypothetical protein
MFFSGHYVIISGVVGRDHARHDLRAESDRSALLATQVVCSVSALGDGLGTGDQLVPLICLTLDGLATRSSHGGHRLQEERASVFSAILLASMRKVAGMG